MSVAVPVQLRSGRPLAPMQRGLWSSQLRARNAPLQNLALLTHLDGDIDPERFRSAFAAVVAASDTLRSRIVDRGSGARIELDDTPAPTDIVDVDREAAPAWAAQRASVALDMAVRGHDSVLLRHGDRTWSWYLAMHHTVTDAASRVLVYEATAAAYGGAQPQFESYYDWAATLEHSTDRRAVKARTFWRDRNPAPRPDQLYRPVRAPSPDSTRVQVPLDEHLTAAVHDALSGELAMISEDLGWTVLLLTSAAAHVHLLSGSTRFSIGLPVHNRGDARTRSLIGPLMELYPVDIEIGPDDTYADLHRRTGRATMTTLRHAVVGTAPAQPDFDVIVNVIAANALGHFGDISASSRWVDTHATDPSNLMRVQLSGYGGVPEIALDLSCAATDPHQRPAAADHHRRVLRDLVSDTDKRVRETVMATEGELAAMTAWGEGPRVGPLPRPITATLRTSLRGASHSALEDGERTWTGDELWADVEHVAAWLAGRGVGRGVRVAVSSQRSAETVTAIIAILVAGGAYVPIDPDQPERRRRELIERAGCLFTIGPGDVAEVLAAPPQDRDPNRLGAPATPGAHDEAYVLFTSGSTGEPKGVPVSHLGLADYIEFALAHYLDDAREAAPPVVPLFSALTFDLTVTSLYMTLAAGGRLVIIAEDGPAGIRRVAQRTDLTWAKATPSHLDVLAGLLPPEHSLSTLVVGGEAFGSRLARRLHSTLPGLTIFNEYGPTEAVVGCMIHRFEPVTNGDDPAVPIGGPAPGVTLAIVDESFAPVPVGVAGELVISHRGLSAGYLDGENSSFADSNGRRWYRSGDLVRMIDNATCTYLGRLDEQIKVSGIRLDPAEVEAALTAHPAISSAAVRSWHPRREPPATHCVRCGLPSNVPGVTFDEDAVCSTCHAYERIRGTAADYFGEPDDLGALRDLARRHRRGKFDALHLLSGGKDSTYALYRLVAMGFDVYAVTLDNGFISEEAKANAKRSVEDLGVDHEFVTTPAMNDIFRDSLERHSNVCHGCYKTIYTLATSRAEDLGIPMIVTGLSRGQLFETRLIPQQFDRDRFDVDAIDRAVIEARKVYHRLDDAPNRLLDTSVFADDSVFDRIRYVDFYRYVDVELAEMLTFLDESAPWVRPRDTGRSTNCLINAAGIHTHLAEQGYHNYAEPYAWDVRLGHKSRAEAIAELDDELDEAEIATMLDEVGYRQRRRDVLTAWYTLEPDAVPPSPAALRTFLAERIPAHAIPAAFVAVEGFATTGNGKLDADALPAPDRVHRPGSDLHVAAESPTESMIVEIWERILGTEPVGIDDDFFDLGGDSLAALEMAIAIGIETDRRIPEEMVFTHTSPRALAVAVAALRQDASGRPADTDDGEERDVAPLGAQEKALLYDAGLDASGIAFNVAHRYLIPTVVDVAELGGALRRVVGHHQALFHSYGPDRAEMPVDVAFEIETVRESWPLEAADARLRELQQLPLDPQRGSIGRAIMVHTTGGATFVGLVVHHVAIDAAGFDVLWRDLGETCAGRPFVSRANSAGPVAVLDDPASRAHWSAVLDSPAVPLRIVAPRPAEPDGYLRRRASVTASELRQGPGRTGFASAMAAFAATLGYYADPDDTDFAISVSTRDATEYDRMGYRLNLLPIRLPLRAGEAWRALVERCDRTLASALSHRRYPFASMVDDERGVGRVLQAPRIVLAYEEFESVSFAGAAVDHTVVPNGVALTDATVFVQVEGDDLFLAIEYRGTAMGAATAEQFLGDLDTLVRAAVMSPAASVDATALPGTDGALRHGPPPVDGDVLEAIESHLVASRSGDRGHAVRCGERTLGWGELDRSSAAVAEELARAGVGPGDRVIVGLPRSVGIIAAIIGVLRAGAAYVPLDPGHPRDRIARLAEQAGAVAALASSELAAVVGSLLPADAVIVLDDLAVPHASSIPTGPHRDPSHSRTRSSPGPAPEDPAYVIFTSGSTGTPKPVTVTRAQLSASTTARAMTYESAPGTFLMVSSPTFDSSVVGIFWTLAAGGTVVIPTDAEVHDLDALAVLIRRDEVTHTLMVPSLYLAILDRHREQTWWPDQVIVAGETCPPGLVALHHAIRPTSALTNEYGPTEATVWATAHRCRAGDDPVPIGEPIAGAWVAVVDDRGRLRPSMVAGELVIGGVGVTTPPNASAAFAHRPELGDGLSFATGDQAATGPDGVLFLGRTDNQINVGGHRVEPEEIEGVLGSVPGVSAVVVVAADVRSTDQLMAAVDRGILAAALRSSADHPAPTQALREALLGTAGANPVLVAHVETNGAPVNAASVRQAARDGLVAASRPTHYVLHDRLERTPHGKLDREAIALRLPDAGASVAPDAEPWAAEPSYDRALAQATELFRTVVGHRDVEPDTSFFDAGGSSLSALALVAGADKIGVSLALATIVDGLTPLEMAHRIRARSASSHPNPSEGQAHDAPPTASQSTRFPVSPSQHRLWLHEQLRTGTMPYVMTLDLELEGPVDISSLERALASMVRAHSTLRSRIEVAPGGIPFAVVDPAPERIELPVVAPEAAEEAAQVLTEPFDLEREHPLRAALIERGDDAHVLRLTMHHMAVDGASLDILSSDLRSAYVAARQREPFDAAAWGPAAPSFAQAALAQRTRLDSGAHRPSLDHWRERLADLEPARIPGRSTEARPTGTVEVVDVFSGELAESQIAALANRLRVTQFSLLAGLTLLWTAAITGRGDVAIGAPVTERRDPRFDGVVGPFVNLMVIRTDVDPADSARTFLQAVRHRVVEAIEHAEVPFDVVVRELGPERSTLRTPFFDVTCAVHDPGETAPVEAGGLRWRRGSDDGWVGGLLSDVMIEACPTAAGAKIVMRHDPGVIEPDAARGLADALAALIAGIVADPDTVIGDLELVEESARDGLLEHLRTTPTPLPAQGDSLFDRVAAAARRRPERVAVCDDAGALSYSELLTASGRVAAELRDRCVGPGDVVAVSIPRSIPLVLAIVGIVEVGATYLPLDAEAPAERCELMRTGAGACATITVDQQRRLVITTHEVTSPPGLPAGEPVAAIMYTSGSTGRPKGAMVTHRGIVRLVHEADYATLDDDTVMGMIANPAFDALTFELWGALCNGGRLEILTPDDVLDPERFAGAIRDRQITTMVVPTSLFNLVSRTRPDAFASMSDLLIGGEALDPASVARVVPHGPRRLVNAYGPTEAAVIAAAGSITEADLGRRRIPIGRPIVNTTVDLVDDRGRLVPIGVEGEIAIGGPAVAAGYIGEPELTAQRFVPCRYRPGVILYRTGDIARRLPDGRLDFVGRRDGQTKLRGHRIELGEIEHAMSAGSSTIVACAASVAGEGERRRIVAHIVAENDVDLDAQRARLRDVLPPVMVPAEMWIVPELPLTPTGKLDRRALAEDAAARIDASARSADGGTVEVSGELEAMCRRWAELLDDADVGPDDDFFELGGHSLLAVELLDDLERRRGIRPSLSLLFEARTPRRLVDALGLAGTGGGQSAVGAHPAMARGVRSERSPVVVLRDGLPDREHPLWLIHPAGGNHLLYEPLAARLGDRLPVFGVEAQGLAGDVAPLDTIDQLAAHQLRWIRDVQPRGPYRLVGYSVGGLIGFEVARRLLAAGETVEYLGVVCAGAPGARPAAAYPKRREVYLGFLRDRDLSGLGAHVGLNARRRLERGAVTALGMRPSARQVDESVRLAMVEAFRAYEGAPADIEVELILGLENEDTTVTALVSAWDRLAMRGVRLARVPGWHDTVLAIPAVDVLAQVIGESLRIDTGTR